MERLNTGFALYPTTVVVSNPLTALSMCSQSYHSGVAANGWPCRTSLSEVVCDKPTVGVPRHMLCVSLGNGSRTLAHLPCDKYSTAETQGMCCLLSTTHRYCKLCLLFVSFEWTNRYQCYWCYHWLLPIGTTGIQNNILLLGKGIQGMQAVYETAVWCFIPLRSKISWCYINRSSG